MLEAIRADAGAGPHDRRGGRADRQCDRMAADGNVPPGRHGRHRHAGARRREFRGTGVGCRADGAAGFIQSDAGAALAGRQDRAGLLQEEKDAEGKEVRLVLDWKTLEYVRAARPKLPSLEMAKNAERLPERLRNAAGGDVKKDKAARFHWRLLSALCGTMRRIACREIADDAPSVDRAMRPASTGRWGRSNSGMRPACGDRRADAGGGQNPSARTSKRLLVAGHELLVRDDHGRQRVLRPDRARRTMPVSMPEGVARGRDISRKSHGVVQAESRRVAGRPGRRRRLHRTALEEERHRRGHRPHADRESAAG